MNLKKRILLLLALLIISAIALAEDKVQVSVLSLLHPEKLAVSSGSSITLACTTANDLIRHEEILPGSFVRVEKQGEQILVQWLDQELLCRRVSFQSGRGEDSLKVNLVSPNSFQRSFLGQLVILPGEKELVLLVVVDLEKLVAQVTAAEMGGQESPMEALKAQAVCVRSYIVAERGRHVGRVDFCDTTHCFLFRGLDGSFGNQGELSLNRAEAATEASNGQVLWRRGTVIAGYYHSACGGGTVLPSRAWGGDEEDGAYTSVKCNYCRNSGYFRWQKLVSSKIINEVFPGVNWKATEFFAGEKGVEIRAESGSTNYSWENFRRKIASSLGWSAIPSFPFEIWKQGESLLISGSGHGHKVGLCQAGAMELAGKENNYQEILKFYFPSCTVSK